MTVSSVDGVKERFEKKWCPEPNSGCWIWLGMGHSENGYGLFRFGGRGKCYLAHRISYEFYVGKIPDGLELDHKCENKLCVNPDHLEPVTHKENMLRMYARKVPKTRCKYGHIFSVENTYVRSDGTRSCICCSRIRGKEWARALACAKKKGLLCL